MRSPDSRFSEAADGDQVLTQLIKSQHDVLLLDINMPGRNGLGSIEGCEEDLPSSPCNHGERPA